MLVAGEGRRDRQKDRLTDRLTDRQAGRQEGKLAMTIILLSNFYYVLNEISAYANSLVVDT